MQENNSGAVGLPFYMFAPAHSSVSEFNEAVILFQRDGSFAIRNQNFIIQNGTLEKTNTLKNQYQDNLEIAPFIKTIPLFSITALVLVIIFRNMFYQTFQKYFVSIHNNYAIDFNIQKIGLTPLIFSLAIILFAFSDFAFIKTVNPNYDFYHFRSQVVNSLLVLSYPILVTIFLLFFLNFSGKIFPIIFSDVKTLLGIAFMVIMWNFFSFGASIENSLPLRNFIIFAAAFFLTIRSFFFFNVFRKAYRFRLPTTVFYICTLNLATFLLLYKGLLVQN